MTTCGHGPSLGGTTLAVLAIFVLSGAAGLIYEIVWSRQLVLVFGNTTQAVSAILTGFFGGHGHRRRRSAAGSPTGSARRCGCTASSSWSLSWSSCVTPITFRLIHEVYRGIYRSLEGAPQLLAIVRLGPGGAGAGPGDDPDGRDVPEPDPPPRAVERAQSRVRTAVCGEHHRRDRSGRSPPGWSLSSSSDCRGARDRGGLLRDRRRWRRSCCRAARTRGDPDSAAVVRRRSPRPPHRPARRPHGARPRGDPGPRAARTAHRVHLGPDVARLPGDVDATARVGHRQHDVRVHGDPRASS